MVAVSFIDTEGADMIETVTEEMGRDRIQIHLAHVHDDVRAFLKEAGTEEVIGEGNIHGDVFEAVEAISGKGG
jgi:anti-anti-sigma regulatory factor